MPNAMTINPIGTLFQYIQWDYLKLPLHYILIRWKIQMKLNQAIRSTVSGVIPSSGVTL